MARKRSSDALEIESMAVQSQLPALREEPYLILRNRVWAVFLQDHDPHRALSDSDRRSTREGNRVPYTGAPVEDRRLFSQNIRSDDSIYQILYGLSWINVGKYGKSRPAFYSWYKAFIHRKDVLTLEIVNSGDQITLLALRAHATSIMKYRTPLLPELPLTDRSPLFNTRFGKMERLFREFVDALVDGGFDQDYQNKEQSAENQAHWKYFHAWKEYEKERWAEDDHYSFD